MINDSVLELQIKRYYASYNQGYMTLPISSYINQSHQPATQTYTTD